MKFMPTNLVDSEASPYDPSLPMQNQRLHQPSLLASVLLPHAANSCSRDPHNSAFRIEKFGGSPRAGKNCPLETRICLGRTEQQNTTTKQQLSNNWTTHETTRQKVENPGLTNSVTSPRPGENRTFEIRTGSGRAPEFPDSFFLHRVWLSRQDPSSGPLRDVGSAGTMGSA